jgi:hypothetical protein
MRSGFTACLLTVGVALMAADKAQALTLTAADFSCYQSGPCPIAGSENSSLQLWDWYEAVSTKEGGLGSMGSKDAAANLRGNGLGNRLNDRVGPPADLGIIFVMGPAFNCLACFLEAKDGSAINVTNGSAGNSGQHLFNLGGWNGTDAVRSSGFFPGFGHSVFSGGPPPPGGSESFATPEPGTMGLVMVGLALLAGPLRRLLRERRSLSSKN